MRPSVIHDELVKLYSIRRNVCIEGPPGGGKTSMCRDVRDTLAQMYPDEDFGYVEVHIPTTPVEDFGIPWAVADKPMFEYKMPWWWPTGGRGLLVFDDRNQGTKDVQKVLANVQQARALHGHILPEGWMIINTGNRKNDNSGANQPLAHLRDRENVVEWETHLDDSINWALKHGVAPEVIGFWRFCPDQLHAFDPNKDVSPTPRSWVEGVSNLMGVVSPETEAEWFRGAVGDGAAAAFMGFLKVYRNLPDPDGIFINPTTSIVPTDSATLYALSGALTYRVTPDNFAPLSKYLERLPKEFSVMIVNWALARGVQLYESPVFPQWVDAHKEVMF